MYAHTTRAQDAIISRAEDAPTFADLIQIIQEMDDKASELADTIDDRDAQIAELIAELKEARENQS